MTIAGRITALDFLLRHLSTISPDTMMSTLMLSDFRTATGDLQFSHADIEQVAREVRSNEFDIVPRSCDEFSEEPYLWITPSPKPAEGIATIPNSFWIIRNPSNTASRLIDEGLLIFTHPGYAAGMMIKEGHGDFNIQSYTKAQLVASGYSHVVLNYVDGHPPTVLPVDR